MSDISEQEYDNSFGTRLEFLIQQRGISKNWLAEKLGITKQAFNYLLKHSSKPKYVNTLAEILRADPLWIEHGEGVPFVHANDLKSSFSKIKIHTAESILLMFREEAGDDIQEYIDYVAEKNDNFFAYRLSNESMFPPFMENTVLIFNKDKTPKNGDFVLLVLESDNSVLVRQYIKDGNDIYFHPKNKNYKSLVNAAAVILGVLVEARYQLL